MISKENAQTTLKKIAAASFSVYITTSTGACYNYATVQKRVNELLSK